MDWTVIITAGIVLALFVVPFVIVSRKHSNDKGIDEQHDVRKQQK